MAFQWKTFQIRTLSAVVFAAVMLTGLLWNQWSFLVLFSVIHFGCWWEYFNLIEKIHGVSLGRNLRDGVIFTGFGLMLWFSGPDFAINNFRINSFFTIALVAIGLVFFIVALSGSGKIPAPVMAGVTAGLFYLSLSWGLMIHFYREIKIELPVASFSLNGPLLPMLIIASIWINDTMAYLIGSLIGRTPLSAISPKKTWEGTIGGILLSTGAIWLATKKIFAGTPLEYFSENAAIIAAIASIAGTLGDLFESKIKRMAGVKDSGNLMPGHGGFLDRFDSMLLAVPAVWLYVMLFVR